MTAEQKIPDSHIEFCKAVAKLAAENNLTSLGMTFRPGFDDEWSDEIQMAWDSGRHGADSKQLRITSTVRIRAEVV